MSRLSDKRYEAEFAAETARLGAALAALSPDDRVPTCPEWTVRDLVTHVGEGHRWSATMVETRAMEPLVPIPSDPAPDSPAEWPGWLADGARRLTDAVRDAGHGTEVWTWQADRTAGFWLRRMTHDELIHRYDVERAAGRPSDVAEEVASDGISDFLDTVATLSRLNAPGWGFPGLRGDGETLRFSAPSGGWLATRTPEGATWTRDDDGPADVVVSGSAWELLLVLNRRLAPGSVTVTGDEALFTHWWENGKF